MAGGVTQVPSLIFMVFAARYGRKVHASMFLFVTGVMKWSVTRNESKPSSSARTAILSRSR